MSLRSRGLLALSVLLLTSAACMAAVLQHDAVDAADPAGMHAGDHLRVRGWLAAWTPHLQPHMPRALASALANDTYLLALDEPTTQQVAILVTAGAPLTQVGTGRTVVVAGQVAWTGQDPSAAGRTLVLLSSPQVDSPLLFR